MQLTTWAVIITIAKFKYSRAIKLLVYHTINIIRGIQARRKKKTKRRKWLQRCNLQDLSEWTCSWFRIWAMRVVKMWACVPQSLFEWIFYSLVEW